LFEEARWEIITNNGYGLEKIRETGLGPTILEINLKFSKEVRLRQDVTIETEFESYKNKIGKVIQRMVVNDDVCCKAELTFALFDTKQRRLVKPTVEWLAAIGL